jgi:AcrR family transcriptional regulator
MSPIGVTLEREPLRALVSPDEAGKRLRIVDAALRCVAERGLRSTTVEEIAAEAGLARATLYRTFPGGREAVLEAVAETEAARFFAALSVELAAATTLSELLAAFVSGATRRLRDSVLLRASWAEEPAELFARLSFSGLDETLALASDFAWPFLSQFMADEEARRAAEFAARVTLSYLVSPEPSVELLEEGSVRRLLEGFVLPGVEALARGEATAG